MPRPTLTIPTLAPNTAGWDAVVNTATDALATFVSGQPYAPKLYTVASGAGQLPAAGSYASCIAMVSDPVSGKVPLVFSDGSNWRYMDNTLAL